MHPYCHRPLPQTSATSGSKLVVHAMSARFARTSVASATPYPSERLSSGNTCFHVCSPICLRGINRLEELGIFVSRAGWG